MVRIVVHHCAPERSLFVQRKEIRDSQSGINNNKARTMDLMNPSAPRPNTTRKLRHRDLLFNN